MLAFYFFATDLIYLVNLIFQISVLNKILSGGFLSYGLETDLNKLFPKTALCTYSDLKLDYTVIAICVLPLNYLTDKFVWGLWWWFLIVAFFTCCMLLHHVIFILSTRYRNHMLCMKGGKYWKIKDVMRIFQGLSESEAIGETVFLQLIIQNIESDTALDLLNLL